MSMLSTCMCIFLINVHMEHRGRAISTATSGVMKILAHFMVLQITV